MLPPDAAWVQHFGLLWRYKLRLPSHVPLHHINVPAWICTGLGANAALCGFMWRSKHSLCLTLHSSLLPLGPAWGQPGRPAERDRGTPHFAFSSCPSPVLQAPVNIGPVGHLFPWVPSVWSEAGCSRWHFPRVLGFHRLSLAPCVCCHRWGESDGGEKAFSSILSFFLCCFCFV